MDDRSDTIVLCPKCGSPPPSVSGCMADDCPSQEIIDMMCQPPANQPVNNSSTAEQKIVEALATYTWRSGHQLCELTGLGPGTLYPALMALEKRGQIISRWEDMPPPRRRRYSLEYANHG